MRTSLRRAFSPLVAPSSRLLACAGLAAAISSGSAQAQNLLGNWDPATLAAGTHTQAYVSPTGNNANVGLIPSLPKRTIDGVLNDPNFIYTGLIGVPGNLVTINVAPGTYDAAAGEVFPLRIPAHGVSLESWTDGTSGPLDRPLLDVGGSVAGIFVDRIGDNTMPPSVVQGLSIIRGFPAIRVDPAGPAFEPAEPIPVSCEIRGNRITSSPLGIRLNTQPYLTSLYVVEDNYVGGPEPFVLGGLIGGVGVEETCGEADPLSGLPDGSAAASTLYRSNRIHLYEIGLRIENLSAVEGDPLTCVPRIFSNFIQLCEWVVRIFDCETFLINNTLAFALNYSGNPLAETLEVTGGSLEYHNNILWSPDTAAGPFFGVSTPIDENFTGVTFPTLPTTNLVFDVSPGTPPNFAGGNAPVAPFPVDLHLTPASLAAIDVGTNVRTLDDSNAVGSPSVARTVRSAVVLSAPGGVVRTDINLDNDLDPRILNPGVFDIVVDPVVDIGGDEFKFSVDIGDGLPPVIDGRIETVARNGTAPATQDEYGNVVQQPGTAFTWQADLFLQGPANGLFIMLAGFGFFDTVTDPVLLVPTQNTSIYQNLYFDGLGWGCFALDPSPAITLNLGFGVFDGLGLFTDAAGNPFFRIPFSFSTQPFEESEIFVQMLVIDPVNRTAFSNRKRLELNVGP